jgi:hypothetical protein
MDQICIERTVPKKRKRKASKEPSGFQCSFCGGFTTNPQEYYSRLTTILAMRLMELLKSSKDPTYLEAVLDSIHAVFGVENRVIRKELSKAGFLDVLDKRHEPKGEGYLGDHKYRCYKCREVRFDHEITIDTISPYVTKYICFDCLAETGDGNE